MRRLAIFDLDGVITSTTDAHFHAWQVLFQQTYGIDLDPRLEVLTRGVSRRDSLDRLLDRVHVVADEVTKEKMAEQKNDHYRQLIDGFTQKNILPGALEVIGYLRGKGLHIALGSASRNAPFLLDRLGISDLFDYVVNPAPLKGKPHPDIFLAAMNHFMLTPAETIGFEDAVAGITAIKRAGMLAVGVGAEDLHEADIRVMSLADLSADMLDSLIKGSFI